ncbi:FAD-binding oxidoreductase [Candidatus Woesearchaeota archaeon]|nr:FAD-binding oxidoreductase [Candidatus Woesearchaeota archaeon]
MMKFKEVFPPTAYSEAIADKITYARDGSEFEGIVKAVVYPTTREQIINLLMLGKSEKLHFTIRGAGTNTLGSCVPANSVVVDLSRMNKIIEITTDSVTVEPGVILGDLLKELKKKGLFFPIKPLEYNVCSIGGLVAMNSFGLDIRYGRVEKWIEELEVIDGNNKKLKVSGAQLKDFVGMEGTTGIIYSIKLKLLSAPLPKTISIFKFNTITALMDKYNFVSNNKHVISVYFLDEFCSSFLELGNSLLLIVEYDNDNGVLKSEEEIANLDLFMERLQHLLINKKYVSKEDPFIPLENIPQFIQWLRKNAIPCYGYMHLGIFHPCFREASPLNTELYNVVKVLKGLVPGEYGIGIKRKQFLSDSKLSRIKSNYDPSKVFNRGVLID